MWTYTGTVRPPFAERPRPGQESVWDYPRPPTLREDTRRITVHLGTRCIADTVRAVRVLETASPPSVYLPPEDVDAAALLPAGGGSVCEWKGSACYWSVRGADGVIAAMAAWSYPAPHPRFARIAGWLSVYPAHLDCRIDGERVRPQPGGFYGGWITDDIAGPVKGAPGTGHW